MECYCILCSDGAIEVRCVGKMGVFMSFNDAQFLKWRLDQIWNTKGCVCPNHVARWNTNGQGYGFRDKEYNILLWYTKGRIKKGLSKKTKGKGFSFLMKGYQLCWRVMNETPPQTPS